MTPSDKLQKPKARSGSPHPRVTFNSQVKEIVKSPSRDGSRSPMREPQTPTGGEAKQPAVKLVPAPKLNPLGSSTPAMKEKPPDATREVKVREEPWNKWRSRRRKK